MVAWVGGADSGGPMAMAQWYRAALRPEVTDDAGGPDLRR
jgi:hypothetical protein